MTNWITQAREAHQGIIRPPEGIREFLHALQARNEKDNGLFPQVASEVEADAKALRRVLAVLDFYHPPRTSGADPVAAAEADLEEMRQHGNADDATEAAAHLERVKHAHGVNGTVEPQREDAQAIWRAIGEEAECVVQGGRKYLLLSEEMCVRLGGALGM